MRGNVAVVEAMVMITGRGNTALIYGRRGDE
jgi:hypothetical protein